MHGETLKIGMDYILVEMMHVEGIKNN